jgi:hypothetical protein
MMMLRLRGLMGAILLLASCGEKDSPPVPPPVPKSGTPRSIPPMSLKAWIPPSAMPEPRELLKGEEWTKRWSEAKAGVDLKTLEKDSCPAYSLTLTQVVAGMQADLAGVKVGDRMVSFDGKPVLSLASLNARQLDQRCRFKLWSPARGSYEMESRPGKLGVSLGPVWLPALAYVRSIERDAKWDEYVVAAAMNDRAQGDLAETALYHAFRAGYRGWLLPVLMARISYDHGRPLESMNYSWNSKGLVPEDQKFVVLAAFFHAALLAGQLDWAVKLDQEWPAYHVGSPGWEGSAEVVRWKRLSEEERNEPSPCTVAAAGRSTPQPPQAFEFNANRIISQLSGSGRALINLTPPQAFTFAFGPGSRDVDFLIDFDLKAFEPQLEGHSPQATFKLVSVANAIEEPFASLDLHLSGAVQPWGPDLPTHWVMGDQLCKRTKNRVELAVRGRQCELRLNDQCIYLGTVEDSPTRRVVCMVSLANVTGAITKIEVTPLETPKTSPSPASKNPSPPESAALRMPLKPEDPTLAWYYHSMVEGYLAQGRRNAAWDQPAVDGLALFCSYLRNESDRTNLAESAALLRGAVGAGCDDPLVLYAHSLTQGYVDLRSYESARGIRRAAEAIRATKYSPSLKCFILSAAGMQWGPPMMDENRRKDEAFEQEAASLLAEALDEENAPGELLLNTMINIGRHHAEGLRDPMCGFEKVSLEAAKAKKGVAPFLAYKGHFYVDFAWRARGGDWARSVTDEGWKLFHHRLEVAVGALEQSWTADPTNPQVPARMITAALGHEKTRKTLAVWVDRALKASPNNDAAISNLIWFLAPRWFGSDEQVLQTGRQYFARAQRDRLSPVMALLLVNAHKQTVMPDSVPGLKPDEETWHADETFRTEGVWKDVQDVFGWILKTYPDSAYYRSLFAAYACGADRWSVAKEQLQILGDRMVPGAFKSDANAREMKALALARG